MLFRLLLSFFPSHRLSPATIGPRASSSLMVHSVQALGRESHIPLQGLLVSLT